MLVYAAFALVLGCQIFLGVWGVADVWTRGHNGWNGAAYQNGARNTLRWGELFPLQYDTANVPPKKEALYTHAPLGLHLHNVAAVAAWGDREASIRLVAAFWSIAALAMLFATVRGLWGDLQALVAATVYTALPINAIYTNMANHSAGFIFWSLLALYLYVRACERDEWSPRTFFGFVAAFTMAAAWDWPAYYVALAIAAHWSLRRRDNARLLLFCGWVFLLFAGHLILVEALTGNVDELADVFNARRALSWERFKTHLWVVPEVMFTWSILGICLAWLVAWAVRLAKRRARARDLVPVAFFVAALTHYLTFRWSAVVHSYWAWPALPFVAIAVSTALCAAGTWIRARTVAAARGRLSTATVDRVATAAALSVGVLLVPLAIRDTELVAQGRSVGGSMWFFTPVRGSIDAYDSGRPELRFAERVREWTDRQTGVQLHPGFRSSRLEPRFDITLDRTTHRWAPRPRPQIENDKGITGWVFAAPLGDFSETERITLAARHPYRQFGDYFMIDLRREDVDIEIWEVAPQPMTARWWLLHSAFEPPVRASRSRAREAELEGQVASVAR